MLADKKRFLHELNERRASLADKPDPKELRKIDPKKDISLQIEQAIARQGLSRVELAKRLKTSRAALNRALDPENNSITLLTLIKISKALDLKINIIFEPTYEAK